MLLNEYLARRMRLDQHRDGASFGSVVERHRMEEAIDLAAITATVLVVLSLVS